jgi:hypothetical protein
MPQKLNQSISLKLKPGCLVGQLTRNTFSFTPQRRDQQWTRVENYSELLRPEEQPSKEKDLID